MVVLYGDDENTITDEAILPSNVQGFVMLSVVSLESCGVSSTEIIEPFLSQCSTLQSFTRENSAVHAISFLDTCMSYSAMLSLSHITQHRTVG